MPVLGSVQGSIVTVINVRSIKVVSTSIVGLKGLSLSSVGEYELCTENS